MRQAPFLLPLHIYERFSDLAAGLLVLRYLRLLVSLRAADLETRVEDALTLL